MARGRIARDRRDGRITDREALDAALGRRGNPVHDRVLSLQQSAGNQAVVQRFREYDDVAANQETGAGKLLHGTGLHYTVSKPKQLAGHFNEFHVTYHDAADGKHPHFYFDDRGRYLADLETTGQNNAWIASRGREAFDRYKQDAPNKAARLLDRQGFPVYEGATAAEVQETHEDRDLAAAGVRSLVLNSSKKDAKTKNVDDFAQWAAATAGGAQIKKKTITGKRYMAVVLEFASFAEAKAAKRLASLGTYNSNAVSMEYLKPLTT